MGTPVNVDALKSEIRACIMTQKANAIPMIVRLAWHASGTYDRRDNSGGSDGATMRFEPEASDPANAGLHIVRDMLLPVIKNHPEISIADIWAAAGCAAVEFAGGPKITPTFGRRDASDGTYCPPVGRLPDGSLGTDHLIDVFTTRMGFDDREIVCLSGAHTLGRCHLTRSGFDGPWTRNPLKFDNTFFKNLLYLDWKPREWDGPLQYEDVLTGELMMLPTDMVLKTDPRFRVYTELYAKDEALFAEDFGLAYSKLLNLGAPKPTPPPKSATEQADIDFMEAAMHGSLEFVRKLSKSCNVHCYERSSGRTALHKAAFWGHTHVTDFLLKECKLNVNARDFNGDTPLHDAVRFGHYVVAETLLKAGSNTNIKNRDGDTVLGVCRRYNQSPKLIALVEKAHHSKL